MNIEDIKKEARKTFLLDEDIREFLHGPNGQLYYTENKIIAHIQNAIDIASRAALDSAIEVVEQERPLGESTNHSTYNDGKRDGSDSIVSSLKAMKNL